MKVRLLFCYCLFFCIQTIGAQSALHIIPEPVSIHKQIGTFSSAGKIAIHFDENIARLRTMGSIGKKPF